MSKKKLIVLVAVLVFLLASSSTFGFLAWKHGRDQETKERVIIHESSAPSPTPEATVSSEPTANASVSDENIKQGDIIPETENTPFWGIWIGAYEEQGEAISALYEVKTNGSVGVSIVVTSEWSNLNPKTYYALTYGMWSSEEAARAALAENASSLPSDAYIKYSGERR